MKHAIALVATGNELIQGEILNRDGQYMAQQLTDHGIAVGDHWIVPDKIDDITHAIESLFQRFDTIITTGGLGPTSDDRTRNAVAAAMQRPLELNEANWQAIQDRLTHLGLKTPSSNKQQAYFPQGATLFPNPHGTAAGCMVKNKSQCLYMLPGPRNECFPMFDKYVLPKLVQTHTPAIKKGLWRWRVFGVSESDIAMKLDEAVKGFDCETGYRVHQPYLDVKLFMVESPESERAQQEIQQAAAPHIICQAHETASRALADYLTTNKTPLWIIDEVTQGLLQSRIVTPHTHPHVHFVTSPPNEESLCIHLTGLKEYWQNQPPAGGQTQLTLTMTQQNNQSQQQYTLPYRSTHVRELATEYASYCIHTFIKN